MSLLITTDSSKFPGVDSANFRTQFSQSISLPEGSTCALVSANIWYSWRNISAAYNNNKFRYYNGSAYVDIIIPDGNYQVFQINAFIQSEMLANGDYDTVNDKYYISIEPNLATLRCRIVFTAEAVSAGYTVDFSSSGLGSADELRDLLGFDDVEYSASTDGLFLVDITRGVNSVHIHTDMISGSYSSGLQDDVIYTFSPDLPPGALLIVEPNTRIYLPVSKSMLNTFDVRLTDQNGRLLDVAGENTSFKFHIKLGAGDDTQIEVLKRIEKLLGDKS